MGRFFPAVFFGIGLADDFFAGAFLADGFPAEEDLAGAFVGVFVAEAFLAGVLVAAFVAGILPLFAGTLAGDVAAPFEALLEPPLFAAVFPVLPPEEDLAGAPLLAPASKADPRFTDGLLPGSLMAGCLDAVAGAFAAPAALVPPDAPELPAPFALELPEGGDIGRPAPTDFGARATTSGLSSSSSSPSTTGVASPSSSSSSDSSVLSHRSSLSSLWVVQPPSSSSSSSYEDDPPPPPPP